MRAVAYHIAFSAQETAFRGPTVFRMRTSGTELSATEPFITEPPQLGLSTISANLRVVPLRYPWEAYRAVYEIC